MSTAILFQRGFCAGRRFANANDNFTSQLHDNLEAVEERAKSLNKSIKSATKKNQAEIQSKLEWS